MNLNSTDNETVHQSKSLIEETFDYLAIVEELEASKAYGPNYILGAIGDEPEIEEGECGSGS